MTLIWGFIFSAFLAGFPMFYCPVQLDANWSVMSQCERPEVNFLNSSSFFCIYFISTLFPLIIPFRYLSGPLWVYLAMGLRLVFGHFNSISSCSVSLQYKSIELQSFRRFRFPYCPIWWLLCLWLQTRFQN